jgi:hypothetical protein
MQVLIVKTGASIMEMVVGVISGILATRKQAVEGL